MIFYHDVSSTLDDIALTNLWFRQRFIISPQVHDHFWDDIVKSE